MASLLKYDIDDPVWAARVRDACQRHGGIRIATLDRVFLESVILRALYDDPGVRSVLFVGTQPYSVWYGDLFRDRTDLVFDTVDPDTSVAACPSSTAHFQMIVQELAEDESRRESYSVVVANGIFGYGTDTMAEKFAALEAFDRLLPSGGKLVIGYNRERTVEPHLAVKLGCEGIGHICTLDLAMIDKERFRTAPLPGFALPFLALDCSGGATFVAYEKR